MPDPRKRANPKTLNQLLQDRSIRHAIYLTRLAGGEAKWVQEQIPELRRTIVRAITPILAEIEGGVVLSVSDQLLIDDAATKAAEASRSFFERIATAHIETLGAIAVAEADFELRLFQQAFPIEMNFRTPSDTFLRSVMDTEPIGGKTVNSWFHDLDSKLRLQINEQIREGMIEGESINDILRRVRGRREMGYTDGIISRHGEHAEAIVRTGVMRASNIARKAFHEENSEVIKGYQVVLTLDSRTCMICVGMEADNPYQISPNPPFHVNCRCVVVPVIKSWQELGIDLEEAEPGTRASMDGAVPADMTWPEWFKTQKEEFQKEYLGPSRYELYKKGMDVTAFVDNGQILTLDELQLLD